MRRGGGGGGEKGQKFFIFCCVCVCCFFLWGGGGGGGVGSLVGCNFEITARNAQNLKFLIVVSRYAEVIVSK